MISTLFLGQFRGYRNSLCGNLGSQQYQISSRGHPRHQLSGAPKRREEKKLRFLSACCVPARGCVRCSRNCPPYIIHGQKLAEADGASGCIQTGKQEMGRGRDEGGCGQSLPLTSWIEQGDERRNFETDSNFTTSQLCGLGPITRCL